MDAGGHNIAINILKGNGEITVSERGEAIKSTINGLREELEELIEVKPVMDENILELSRELDHFISLYYIEET